MKNLFLISVTLTLLLFACKGEKNHKKHNEVKPPDAVTAKFASLYPDVKRVEWDKVDNAFVVEFIKDEKELSASFDSTGNLVNTGVEIPLTDLPAAIKERLEKFMKRGNVKEASKITDTKGVITYSVEFKKDLIFSVDGKILNGEEDHEHDNSDVPQVIKDAFNEKFKDIEHVRWQKEGEQYEAEFELNDVATSANFDASGNILETEIDINVKDLPAAVNEYVAKKLSGATIKEAAKITDAKGIVTFEAEINGQDYIFDQNGKFIKNNGKDND